MAKKKRVTKAQAEIRHFQRRCRFRVGEDLNRKQIERDIRAGNLEFYEKSTNRVVKYFYNYKDKKYVVVYDKMRGKLVTIYEYQEKKYIDKVRPITKPVIIKKEGK